MTTIARAACRLRALGLLVLLVASAVIVPSGAVAAPASPVDLHHAAQAVLDIRAAALRSGDEQAYMATVDPSASDTFKHAQQLQYEGFRSLPVVDLQLTATTATSGDLASGLGLAAKHHADAAYLPESRQRYEFDGYDDRPDVQSYWYTYVERGGHWYIAADDDAEILGLSSPHNLWDAGPLAVQRTSHFLVLTHPDQVARGQRLAGIAEQAIARFDAQWPEQWSERIPLLVPASPQEASQILVTSGNVAEFSAFVTYTPLRDDGWTVTAARMYTQDANLAGESDAAQVGTLVHELTHAATSGITGPFTPIWLQEGLAEYERLGLPADVAVTKGGSDDVPAPADFVSQDRSTLALAYNEAASAVAFLAQAYGKDAPVQLFEALGQRRLDGGSPSYNVDVAMQQVTG